MRLRPACLPQVLTPLRKRLIARGEVSTEEPRVVSRGSECSVGVKRIGVCTRRRDYGPGGGYRFVRNFWSCLEMNADDIVMDRQDGNGGQGGDERVMEEDAPMAVEERGREDPPLRVNVAADPAGLNAEMLMLEERLDESAPSTPDFTQERVDLSGLHGRGVEAKFSASRGSASKRMRLESPVRLQVDDIKERHIARAWEHWRSIGSPKLHVAPMVDQSELPFRMLCRKYGASAAYTPMLHSRLFVQDPKYRKEFTTCPEDRPLLVQFCANNPDTLLEAGRLVESSCDYVDLNLGCPQRIAKKGNYGAFLMDNLPLVQALVTKLSSNLRTPVSCKIRLFPDINHTLAYARMLEDAGCSLLAVHGRTRDQKNGKQIRADWEAIKRVRESLRIPVLANGNIRWLEDVEPCIAATGAEGVLSAESILENPAMFFGYLPAAEAVALEPSASEPSRARVMDERALCLEYLDFCEKYPVPMRMVRGHVHKMLGNYWFRHHPGYREELNKQFKLSLEWLKDLIQRMTALPLPHAGSCSDVPEKRVVESMTAAHGVGSSNGSVPDAGSLLCSGITHVTANVKETVTVK